MCKFSRILSLSALHIASGFFLSIAPAPTLHAQTDSPSQSPDQTEPKLGAYSFSIPAQNANEALTELAKQANTTLLFPFDLAKKVKTNALEGTFTLNEALAQLLEGTELAVVTDESGAVSIRSRSSLVAKETQTQDTEKKTDEGGNGLERLYNYFSHRCNE